MQLFNSPKRNLKFKSIFSFKVINTKENKNETKLNSTIQAYDTNSYAMFLNEESIFDMKCKSFVEINKNKPIQVKKQTRQIGSQRNISMRRILSNSHFRHKKNHFNVGRWTEDEHKKFIQAIFQYGNDWKLVQKHIKTRSSTQSRSHSQKFFLKLRNLDVPELNSCDLSISALYTYAQSLSEDDKDKLISVLLSYEYSDIEYDAYNENDINFYSFNIQNYKYMDSISDVISKKRKIHRDKEDEDSIRFYSQNSKVSTSLNELFSNMKNEATSSYDQDDDFRNEFLNVFSNKRKNSFEDNVFILYSNQISINNSHSSQNSQNSQTNPTVQSMIRTYQSQSPLLLKSIEMKKEEEWFIL